MPKTDDDIGIAECDTCWRAGFWSPAVFGLANIFMWALIIKYDSLLYLIDKDRLVDAELQFRKVYKFDSEEDFQRQWYKMREDRDLFLKTKTQEPTLSTIFSDRKYRPLTIFLILSAIVNQCSGINAINVYSAKILGEIPGISVGLGVYLLSIGQVVGALCGPVVSRFFSVRGMIITGQFLIAGSNACVILFQVLDIPIMILISMIAIMVFYQTTMGSYYFVYASQVATET